MPLDWIDHSEYIKEVELDEELKKQDQAPVMVYEDDIKIYPEKYE